MLINFVQAEISKFKGTKTLYMLLIGVLIVPLIVSVFNLFQSSNVSSSFSLVVSLTVSFLLIILGAMIINTIFSIDFKTDTLKSIIPLPVSEKEYLNGKLATLLIWLIGFSIFTWIFSIILFIVFGIGFDFNVAITSLWQLIFGSILIFLILTPIVFVYLLSKSHNLTLIVTIVLLLFPIISVAGAGMDFLSTIGNYVPWSYVGSLVTNTPLNIDIGIAYGVIILVFIVGYIASYLCLKREYDS